jgi:putative toxin-antitoxin system antitoxin component (TIGR02293 family)
LAEKFMAKPAPRDPRPTKSSKAPVSAPRRRSGGHRRAHDVHVRLLGLERADALGLLERVEAGFPFHAFERFRSNAELSTQELAQWVHISPRTLVRRREQGSLSAEESDRLLRVSRLFGRALMLFEGDVGATRAWLRRSAPALGGRTPQDLASTEVGAREVEDLIGRLEHGVFS